MKKSIIAAGASAAALAAMPIVGVFAASPNSFQDTLRVAVQGGCTIEDSETAATQNPAAPGTYVDRIFPAEETPGTPVYKSIAAGTVGYLNANDSGVVDSSARSFTVACNTADTSEIASWSVIVSAEALSDGNSHTINPGATYSGATSAYGIQSNATIIGTGTTTADPYASYTYVTPASGDNIFLSAANGVKVKFNPSYKVYIAPDQATGNYQGTVTYTISLPD